MQHHVFGALGKPLYVLIAITGIDSAAAPFLINLNPNEGLHVVREILNKGFDLGVFAILFWLFFGSRTCGGRNWRIGRANPTASWMTC